MYLILETINYYYYMTYWDHHNLQVEVRIDMVRY